MNSDVFTGIVVVDWLQMTEEYYKDKTAKGITESSLYEISLTLKTSASDALTKSSTCSDTEAVSEMSIL